MIQDLTLYFYLEMLPAIDSSRPEKHQGPLVALLLQHLQTDNLKG